MAFVSFLNATFGLWEYIRLTNSAEALSLYGRTEFVRLAEALRDDSPDPVLSKERTIDFSAGRHDGYAFDIAANTVASFNRTAWIDGARATHVASGPLVGYWVPTARNTDRSTDVRRTLDGLSTGAPHGSRQQARRQPGSRCPSARHPATLCRPRRPS